MSLLNFFENFPIFELALDQLLNAQSLAFRNLLFRSRPWLGSQNGYANQKHEREPIEKMSLIRLSVKTFLLKEKKYSGGPL